MFCKLDNRPRPYDEYTLIVPCVSVGNVGQLTADLLISTLWMSRIGHIFHESLLPLVGNDPFAHPDATTCKLATTCEVYESSPNKIMIIQQRSPFVKQLGTINSDLEQLIVRMLVQRMPRTKYVKGKRTRFLEDLLDWVEQLNFARVIMLSSMYAHERLDHQLSGSQLRYLATPSVSRDVVTFFRDTLRWIELEPRLTLPHPPQPGSATDELYIPGGGLAARCYRQCEDRQVPLVVLMMFCSEGDNASDALSLATHINDWLNVIDLKDASAANDNSKMLRKIPNANDTATISSWKIPSSWRLNFGNSVDATLF